jgi:hypothetical protein
VKPTEPLLNLVIALVLKRVAIICIDKNNYYIQGVQLTLNKLADQGHLIFLQRKFVGKPDQRWMDKDKFAAN